MRTPQAITSIINQYGVAIIHQPRPVADEVSPWKAEPTKAKPTQHAMKGLMQHLRADHSDRLPEGGMKAALIVLMARDQPVPLPGDDFLIEQHKWRATTILPHSSSRRHRLLEVMVTSRGEPNE